MGRLNDDYRILKKKIIVVKIEMNIKEMLDDLDEMICTNYSIAGIVVVIIFETAAIDCAADMVHYLNSVMIYWTSRIKCLIDMS